MFQFTSFKNVTKKSSSSRNGCIKSRGITWKVQEQSSKSNQQLKLFQLGKHVKMSKLVPLINALHSIAWKVCPSSLNASYSFQWQNINRYICSDVFYMLKALKCYKALWNWLQCFSLSMSFTAYHWFILSNFWCAASTTCSENWPIKDSNQNY